MVYRSLVIVAGIAAAVALTACDRDSAPASQGAPAAAAADIKPYPLKTCIVSDEPLGSMGEPVVMIHEGQEVKFCCEGCTDDFKKNPAKYLAKLGTPSSARPADDHTGHDHDH